MKYHSFLYSVGNQFTPDKLSIVKVVVEEHYQKFLNENDHIVVVIEINVLLWPNLKKINQIEKQLGERVIVFILDVFSSEFINSFDLLENVDEIWCAEPDIYKKLGTVFDKIKFMPLLHTDKLKNCINKENPEIDVVLYSWPDFFSTHILSDLLKLGHKVFYTNYLDDLNKHLGNSKIALWLSPYENVYQEHTKIRYLLSNNKCVVTTKSKYNNFPDIIERDRDDMLSTLFYLLNDDRWKNFVKSDDYKVAS